MNISNIDPRNSVYRSVGLHASLFIAVVLAYFRILPMAQAVSPAPDGGYADRNTEPHEQAKAEINESRQAGC